MAGKRKEQKARTRRELRVAGLRCFKRLGIADTGVGDISREAGVAHGTFYVHFKDKDSLIAELVEQVNRGLIDAFAECMQGEEPATVADAVVLLATRYLQYWSQHFELVPLYLYHAGRQGVGVLVTGTNPYLPDWIQELIAPFRPTLSPEIDPTVIVHGLVGSWRAIAMYAASESEEVRAGAAVTLTRLTLALLNTAMPGVEHAPAAAGVAILREHLTAAAE